VACLPSGCYYTLTTSTISAQPGCTLGDGTKLPRVDISCPGPSSSLRFRPSFTLCTKAGAIHHIEVAEDEKKLAGVAGADQKMGDIDSTAGFQTLKEFGPGAVVDTSTPSNAKGCGTCHSRKGTVSSGGTLVTLYEDIPPDRGILFSNDPGQGPPPSNQTPLSEICAGIQASPQLATDPTQQKLAVDLCNELVLKLR
jgi:hypothetical protein